MGLLATYIFPTAPAVVSSRGVAHPNLLRRSCLRRSWRSGRTSLPSATSARRWAGDRANSCGWAHEAAATLLLHPHVPLLPLCGTAHKPIRSCPLPYLTQALRALRAAQATLEGLPAELLGRVNQSGRWSFKQMLADMPGGGGDGRSPPKADLNGVPGGFNRRLPAAAATQQQLSAAQKAAMQAVSLLSGGIAAHRSS